MGSLICGVSTSSNLFIVGRAVAGCGGAGILNGGLTIIAAAAPLPKRPSKLLFLLQTLADRRTSFLKHFSVSLLDVRLLVSHWDPLLVEPSHNMRAGVGVCVLTLSSSLLGLDPNLFIGFYLNLPIGAVTFVILTTIRIPDAKIKVDVKPSTKEQLDRLDLPGCAIFAPAIIMLLLALEWGGVSYPWSSPTVIGLFCGGAATFCLFIGWEFRRGERAMMPLGLFRNSIVSCAVIANIVSNGAFFLITYYLPLWFQVVKDASPLMSGVYTLPSVLSQITGTIITGFLGKSMIDPEYTSHFNMSQSPRSATTRHLSLWEVPCQQLHPVS